MHFFNTRVSAASAAKTLAGSSGDDQSGRIKSSHSIIEELASRTGWDCQVVTSPGHFWPFWVIFGHFGSFSAILGHFWLFWVIFGHFGSFLAILGHFWAILGHFRAMLDHFGPFEVIFGPLWGILGHFWPFLAIFGPFRGIFGQICGKLNFSCGPVGVAGLAFRMYG